MSNLQKSVLFLAVVNNSLGNINVNFDAETASENISEEDYSKIHDLGFSWSETFQTSPHVSAESLEQSASRINNLLQNFGDRLSANLVIGNAAYGLDPSHRTLRDVAHKIASPSKRELKLGAEGRINGRRTIRLASKTNSIAYVLHTNCVWELLDYASEKKARSMVYSLLRISSSKSRAAEELVRIKGMKYFQRRGIFSEDEISCRLGDFSMFGTTEQVNDQIQEFLARGASKVVVYPVFESVKDLICQIKQLSVTPHIGKVL
jgi:hypothetical protein